MMMASMMKTRGISKVRLGCGGPRHGLVLAVTKGTKQPLLGTRVEEKARGMSRMDGGAQEAREGEGAANEPGVRTVGTLEWRTMADMAKEASDETTTTMAESGRVGDLVLSHLLCKLSLGSFAKEEAE